jgi:hypothetical protein
MSIHRNNRRPISREPLSCFFPSRFFGKVAFTLLTSNYPAL